MLSCNVQYFPEFANCSVYLEYIRGKLSWLAIGQPCQARGKGKVSQALVNSLE